MSNKTKKVTTVKKASSNKQNEKDSKKKRRAILLGTLIPVTAAAIGVGIYFAARSCATTNQGTVTLSDEVKGFNIELGSYSVAKGKNSSIELKLPTGAVLSSTTLTMGDSVVSIPKDGGSITDGVITIPQELVLDNNIVVEAVRLRGSATSSVTGVEVVKGTQVNKGEDSTIVLNIPDLTDEKYIDGSTLEVKIGDQTYGKTDGISISGTTIAIPKDLMRGYLATITKLEIKSPTVLNDRNAFEEIYRGYLKNFTNELIGEHTGKWYWTVLPEGSKFEGKDVAEQYLYRESDVDYDITESTNVINVTLTLDKSQEIKNLAGRLWDDLNTYLDTLEATYNITYTQSGSLISFKAVDKTDPSKVMVQNTFNDHTYLTKLIDNTVEGSETKFENISYVEQDTVEGSVSSLGTASVHATKYGKYVKNMVIPESYYPRWDESNTGYIIDEFNIGEKDVAAFTDCYMESFTIEHPENFYELSVPLFNRCKNLKSFTIPANVSYIHGANDKTNPYPLIQDCENLADVYFEHKSSWHQVDGTETLNVEDSKINATNLKTAEEKSKDNWGYTGLESVHSEGDYCITPTGDVWLWEGAEKTTDPREIPEKVDGITVVGVVYEGFKGCTNKSITFAKPENIKYLSASAFEECTNLTSFSIPKNVNTIGYSCFRNCSQLTSVTFENTDNWYQFTNEGVLIDVKTDPTTNATNLRNCETTGTNWGNTGIGTTNHQIVYKNISYDSSACPASWKLEKWPLQDNSVTSEDEPWFGFTFNGNNATRDVVGHFEAYIKDTDIKVGTSETKLYTCGTTPNALIEIDDWKDIAYFDQKLTVKFVEE